MYLKTCLLSFTILLVILAVCANGEMVSNDIKADPNTKFNRLSETSINLIESLRKQIRAKETELQKAEVLNKNFERLVQLVNILGQVDTFLTEKTKVLIKKLAALAKEDGTDRHDSLENRIA